MPFPDSSLCCTLQMTPLAVPRLDFMEFLCLIYYWQTQGDLFSFFRTDNNINTVKMAFTAMQKCVLKYDEV